ncbi:MAG: hypothetical protein ACQEP0_05125 [Natrinema limicola]
MKKHGLSGDNWMQYFWLNQRNEPQRGYSDKEGEVYHYRSTVAGSKKLSEGDWFVYYMPGEYVLFGAGQIGNIKTSDEIEDKLGESSKLTDYYAHIDKYRPFDPPIPARSIKEKISFLRNRKGLSGVPQNSIYEISWEDYLTILEAADEADVVLGDG